MPKIIKDNHSKKSPPQQDMLHPFPLDHIFQSGKGKSTDLCVLSGPVATAEKVTGTIVMPLYDKMAVHIFQSSGLGKRSIVLSIYGKATVVSKHSRMMAAVKNRCRHLIPDHTELTYT